MPGGRVSPVRGFPPQSWTAPPARTESSAAEGSPSRLPTDAFGVAPLAARSRRRDGDPHATTPLGRRRRRADAESGPLAAPHTRPLRTVYANLCYSHLVGRSALVTEATFDCRARDWAPGAGAVQACPALQELYHADRVAARRVVDVDCTLVPTGSLPSRYVPVQVRSLGDEADTVPCWAWGDGALTETMLNVVSLHTLVWQARLTGYVLVSLCG